MLLSWIREFFNFSTARTGEAGSRAREFSAGRVYRIWRWRLDAHVTLGERARRKTDDRVRETGDGTAESRGNGSRPGVYVHFHFDASPAFHPTTADARAQSCAPFAEFADGIREVIKRGDRATETGVKGCEEERRVSIGEEREERREKETAGLRTCGKRPLVSGALKSGYRRRPIIISRGDAPF